jgi:hypothetical protein
MTATLTFDLNDHDERQAHMRCVKSLDMALVLWEIETRMRRLTDDSISNFELHNQVAMRQAVELTLDYVRDFMAEHNINLDDLVS